jgi:2-polyprenyl-3-methyl-5-hydroxy-6-metoxy-1,4-benzoquinol methylase
MKDNPASQKEKSFFDLLEEINTRPEPFACYTADELWTHEHTSEKMLQYHLDGEVDISSRKKEFLDASVEWITSRFNVASHSRIVDFGCGPGLYARRLAEKGAQVTGIDFSARSINYAKEAAEIEGLKIHYVNKDYFDWRTDEKYDLIMMIMCDYAALSPAQRSALLKKFRKMLNPGGSVLLDVYSLSAFRRRKEVSKYGLNLMDGFWAGEKYFGFLNTYRYEKEKVVLDKYTIITDVRIRTIYNWFKYFGTHELKEEFSKNGLNIIECYGDVAGRVYSPEYDEFAVIATAQ